MGLIGSSDDLSPEMAASSRISKESTILSASNLLSFRRKSLWPNFGASLLASTLAILCWWASGVYFGPTTQVSTTFQWDQTTPSQHLVYHDCFDGKQCARLEVPMDWNETEPGAKVAIAIIKIPAKVKITDPRYGGPILINPGGPGGSGIGLLLEYGEKLQEIVDASVHVKPMPISDEAVPKYYDIVGWDPRGVNNTTPPLNCFPNAFERLAWNLQAAAGGLIGLPPDSFANAWARAKALGSSCAYGEESSQSKNGERLGNFMNTTPVVRDMVEMIEKHGEWREQQARQWLASKERKHLVKAATSMQDEYHESQVVQRTRWTRGQEKLLCWGFSYGTVIGATFVAMYPERVGRVILDGVLDSYEYYNSSALNNIQDADKALDYLLKLCFESGSREKCGLYDPHGAEEIKSNLFSIIDTVKENPFPVGPSVSRGPQLITASDIDQALHLALYSPLDFATPLFHAMHNFSLGDGSWFAEFKRASMVSDIAAPPETCKKAPPWTPECQMSGVLDSIGGMGIECSDGVDIQDRSPETFKAYWELLSNSSKLMGSRRAFDRLRCTHWEMRPKWRFTGPFEGNTSHPVLLISNTLDPTTPLRSAHKIASGFPGAVVLEQNAVGHCSLSAPSRCTGKYVRQYFQSGELPAGNTVCEVDEIPFIGKT